MKFIGNSNKICGILKISWRLPKILGVKHQNQTGPRSQRRWRLPKIMSINNLNRLANSSNPYQGKNKKVLCVCSAGLLRSPTVAHVLSGEPYNFNTRCAGLSEEYALIYADDVLLHWADLIVCMSQEQETIINLKLLHQDLHTPVYNLDIPDRFGYRDPELVKLIKERFDEKNQEVVQSSVSNSVTQLDV